MNATPNRSIQSVETSTEIIDHLRETRGASVSALASHTGLTAGAVHTHLQTLREAGYVVKRGKTYDLGPELLTLGEYVRYNNRLYQAGKEQIDELADEAGECAHLVTEHQGKLYAVYEQFGSEAVGVEYHNRKRQQPFDLHCTAAGKAILASLDEDRRDEIVAQSGLPAQTEHTITSREELLDDLATVDERGYAVVDEEQMLGIRAVGAAIMDRDGVSGAITVSGPVSTLRGERFAEELPEMVKHAKAVCEVNLQAVSLE